MHTVTTVFHFINSGLMKFTGGRLSQVVRRPAAAKVTGVRFSTGARPVLEPSQSPIGCAPEALFPMVIRPKRGADHSPACSAEVKMGEAIHPLPNTCS
jgi:hypothetical protein